MRTMAQRGAMLFGVVFLLVGIWGLFVPNGMTMMADMDMSGKILGLFPVNILHNLVHIAFGVWGLLAARSWAASRSYGRLGAVIYLVLALLAFVTPTTFGLIPIGGNDIWLHFLLAAGLAVIGWASGPEPAHATV